MADTMTDKQQRTTTFNLAEYAGDLRVDKVTALKG